MKLLEHWRWRYRDRNTGRTRRTDRVMTEHEAAKYPGAERIDGSMVLLEPEGPEFDDTGPEVYRAMREPDPDGAPGGGDETLPG
jgi:hypothetical protein